MFIMKTKKLFTILLAIALVTTFVISASAATLSDVTPFNSTEVKAAIDEPGYVSYVINTRAILSGNHYEDGVEIRRCATENNVTMFTSLDTVRVLLDVLEETTLTISTIDA